MVAALTVEIRQLLGQQRVDDAIPKLEKALKEFPGETELSALLAYSNEILAARRRTDSVNELAKRAKTLLRNGKPREAETLLKEGLRQFPDEEAFVTLLKRAQDASTKEQEAAPDIPVETTPTRTADETVTVSPAGTGFGRVRNPEKLVEVYRTSIWRRASIGLLLLIVAGLVGWWALIPHKTPYQQEFEQAKSYAEQKEFGKAIDVLQKIPSNSPLYKQAQDLLVTARQSEKQQNLDVLVAQLQEQHKQNQDDQATETIRKVLDLDPANRIAISVRDEIQKNADDAFGRKTQAEQDQYVKETLAAAQQLFTDGHLEEARARVDEVQRLRADDRNAATLSRRIATQIEALTQMNSERLRSETARASAEKARAAELDPQDFTQAQRSVDAARGFETSKRFDQASKKYGEAADLFRASENAAQSKSAATQLQQRNQAEAARADYEQSRARARTADAETKATARFQAASARGTDAQTKFDKSDFPGARADFDAASKGMAQAADDATAATQLAANQAQLAGQRAAMDTARTEMENTKRGFSGTDAAATAAENRAQQLSRDGKFGDATTAYQQATSLYREAVRKDAQKKDAAQKDDNDRRSISALLDQYRDAYQASDLNAVHRVYPGLAGGDEAKVKNMFANSRSIQLSIEVNTNEIQITGDTAKLTTKESLKFLGRQDNKQQTNGGPVTFVFRKNTGGAWVIQSITRS
jgi:ketosteroid isomerase-like protein